MNITTTPEQYLIRVIRARGLTTPDIAAMTGLTYTNVFRALNGAYRMRAEDYLIICRALELDPWAIFEQ